MSSDSENVIYGTEEDVSKKTDVPLLKILIDTERGFKISVIEFPVLLRACVRLSDRDKASIEGVIKVLQTHVAKYQLLLSQ